jgi:hypothetical protein
MSANAMKLFKVVAIVALAVLVGFFVWNPLGVCKRHELLYARGAASANGHKMSVVMDQCGWREEGRVIFFKNSFWGSPFRVLVFSGYDAKNHRISGVLLHDDETGEDIPLAEDPSWSRGGKFADRQAWFASTKQPLPYHNYTARFYVETIDEKGAVLERASFHISVLKSYKEYWGVDAWDALMSV